MVESDNEHAFATRSAYAATLTLRHLLRLHMNLDGAEDPWAGGGKGLGLLRVLDL